MLDESTIRRQHLLEYLQNHQSADSAIIIGAVLVVEGMFDGERLCFLMTSDASGKPLAWHTQQGLLSFADSAMEFDWEEPEEDE